MKIYASGADYLGVRGYIYQTAFDTLEKGLDLQGFFSP